MYHHIMPCTNSNNANINSNCNSNSNIISSKCNNSNPMAMVNNNLEMPPPIIMLISNQFMPITQIRMAMVMDIVMPELFKLSFPAAFLHNDSLVQYAKLASCQVNSSIEMLTAYWNRFCIRCAYSTLPYPGCHVQFFWFFSKVAKVILLGVAWLKKWHNEGVHAMHKLFQCQCMSWHHSLLKLGLCKYSVPSSALQKQICNFFLALQ